MKNFSDLLDIEHDIKIRIKISAIIANGRPRCRIVINQHQVLDRRIDDPVEVEHLVNLKDPIKIEISMNEKNYSTERETAVIIDSVEIDGLELIPEFVHLADYRNEHGTSTPTFYLGINGVWIMDISEPFYRWRHHVTGQGWLLDPI